MKETKIMRVFNQYIKKFDMNKGNVKVLYFHSIKKRRDFPLLLNLIRSF